MKRNLTFFAFLISLMFLQLSVFAQLNDKQTGAVWLWGSTLTNETPSVVVNTLANNNVTRVYLLVKGSAGSMTDASVLTDFIARAHAKNIKIDFWFIVGQDDQYLMNNPNAHVYHCPKPSDGHADPYIMTSSDVNFLYPGYKDYVLNKINYLLTNFDCDGIHLDHIRFSHLVYSWDSLSIKLADSLGCNTQRLLSLIKSNYTAFVTNAGFVSYYGIGDTDFVKWVSMRKNVIYDYIKSIRDLIAQVKPGISLSAAFMPEGSYDPNLSDCYYAQNYALHSHVLDVIAPMAYFNDYGQSTSWLKTVTMGAVKQADPKCKIYTGYQTYGGTTVAQVQEQMKYALDGGAAGLVNFRYGTTTDDQWGAIKSVYKGFDSSKVLTSSQIQKMANNVCTYMNSNLAVPDSIYTDSSNTTTVSAADFYYMMVSYLHNYIKNDTTFSDATPLIRSIKGPANPSGTQTGNQILKADLFAQAQISAGYIDTNKVLPNCVTVDTVSYDMPSMFWAFARAINYYLGNGVWPNYATIKTCKGPNTWTYGDIISAVEENSNEVPTSFNLKQNYPNPFNPTTMIEFALPKAGIVTLKVYDILGKEVTTLINQQMNSGSYKINFKAAGLASGIYFYRLQSASNVSVKKMMLLK